MVSPPSSGTRTCRCRSVREKGESPFCMPEISRGLAPAGWRLRAQSRGTVGLNGSLEQRCQGSPWLCDAQGEQGGKDLTWDRPCGRAAPWSRGPQGEQLRQPGCGSGPAKWGSQACPQAEATSCRR